MTIRRYRSAPAWSIAAGRARLSILNASRSHVSKRSSARWARLPSRRSICNSRRRSKAILSGATGSNGTTTAPDLVPGAQIVQSWDVASTTGDTNDWSVCTIWLMVKRNYYLLDLWRGRLEFPFLMPKLLFLASAYKPNRILIEQTGPGLHLIQQLRASPVSGVPIPIGIKPEGDKLVRMEAQAARFESGQVFLPREAPWLAEFLHEIFGFP